MNIFIYEERGSYTECLTISMVIAMMVMFVAIVTAMKEWIAMVTVVVTVTIVVMVTRYVE